MPVTPRLTGEQIIELRKSRQLNQTDFGKIFGVSRRAVAAWEANAYRAPADLLARFTESEVTNVKNATAANETAMIELDAYRTMRKHSTHAEAIAFWQRQGFTPSLRGQEMILEAFPDILKS